MTYEEFQEVLETIQYKPGSKIESNLSPNGKMIRISFTLRASGKNYEKFHHNQGLASLKGCKAPEITNFILHLLIQFEQRICEKYFKVLDI